MEHLPEAGVIPATSDIELTKKGEEYCRLAEACGVSFITIATDDPKSIGAAIDRLIGMLDAMEFDPDLEPWLGASENHPTITWSVTADDSGSQLENWSQAGDDREGEHDERELDNADYEPWLGASERHPDSGWGYGYEIKARRATHTQIHWADGDCHEEDREEQCEDEGAQCEDEGAITGDDEYSLGWQLDGSQEHLSMWGEYEADLGTTEEVDQVRRLESRADRGLVQDGEPTLGWCENHGRGVRLGESDDDREHDAGDDGEPELDGGEEETYGESLAPIPGGGSVCQYEDGWRPAPGSAVAPAMMAKAQKHRRQAPQDTIPEISLHRP